MGRFRSKPVEVEAFSYSFDNAGGLPEFMLEATESGLVQAVGDDVAAVRVRTQCGWSVAFAGDFIILLPDRTLEVVPKSRFHRDFEPLVPEDHSTVE